MQAGLLTGAIKLRSIQRPYQNLGWVEAVGASGTIRSVASIATAQNWSENGIITMEALDNIIAHMVQAGHYQKFQLEGLSAERANVLAGGVAVLKAAFDRLKIERMIVSDGALREGVLYDLQGRIQHDDERDHAVNALARRYHVDEAHAERVCKMATELYEQVAVEWEIDSKDYLSRLQWAATLHEVGLAISHDQYHKHSAYLVAHSDLPGFSREEQQALAVMMRGQRRSFPRKHIKQLSDELQLSTTRLTILLRLSLVFNRGRSEKTDTRAGLSLHRDSLVLSMPDGWLAEHPLTEADLLQEKQQLKDVDIRLKLRD